MIAYILLQTTSKGSADAGRIERIGTELVRELEKRLLSLYLREVGDKSVRSIMGRRRGGAREIAVGLGRRAFGSGTVNAKGWQFRSEGNCPKGLEASLCR